MKTTLPFLLILITLIQFSFCTNNTSNAGESTAKPLKYSANKLMQKFDKNAIKYDTLFARKAIELEGIITEIEVGTNGETIFTLDTKSKDQAKLKCIMLSDDMQYEPGKKVCLIGFYKEFNFHVFLDKCITCNSK